MELNFIDVLARLAVWFNGRAQLVDMDSEAGKALLQLFEALRAEYLEQMQEFVSIDIDACELITSPAYDIGFSREQLVEANPDKIPKLV